MSRLPGIRFETLSPPIEDVLPRMDIAAFIGFAASGPVQIPVAVEDMNQFAAIFGADIALARTAAHGETLYGYLAPTVRAFFRNGGSRCWIVRVAHKPEASKFAINGLVAVEPDGTFSQAWAVARSPGSWADNLRVRSALTSSSLVLLSSSLAGRTFDFELTSRSEIQRGDLLGFAKHGDRISLFAEVRKVEALETSPPNPSRLIARVTTGPVYGPDPGAVSLTAARLGFDLIVERPDTGIMRMPNLGFSPDHPRYWATLPTDKQLFTDPAPVGLALEAATPRFPLAGQCRDKQRPDTEPPPRLFLPVSMPFFASDPAEADHDKLQTPLERDGLANIDASLFLDPQLRETGANDLLNEADYIRYRSPSPRRLAGIHSVLAIEEATLVAAPDALHRGWIRNFVPPPANPPSSPPFVKPSDRQGFLDCSHELLAPPNLSATLPDANGSFGLDWTASPPEDGVSVLEEAPLPDFSVSVAIYRGPRTSIKLFGRPRGTFYYRVRRERASSSSNWSNGIAIRIDDGPAWIVKDTKFYDDHDLLDVQHALLRMCAARGDLFAILSVPEHYREKDVLAHVARLEPKAPGTAESVALGYGALYYPWLTGREETVANDIRTVPPEGATAGVMASRAMARGAWVAPANEPLRSPVALGSPVSPLYWQALQDARVNLIRQEPGGFICLNSDTLSNDDDLRPLNVRRLLMLLRRAALRKGATYVFEPNNNAFRRTVERGFEDMLSGMFLRGAFAGATSSSAFQVVTGDSLNTPASVEQGRFIIELRVAPSKPLRFLTVRLLQTSERVSIAEGQ